MSARSGHARTLVSAIKKGSSIGAGFPTTTASALATLTTGQAPGQHGLVGYSVLDAAHDRVVNQLSGWDARLDPATWQRSTTVFETAAEHGVAAFAIGPPRYSDSGYTRAALRGAEYLGAASIADRFSRARTVMASAQPALTYLYVPELDQLAHRHGVESPEWTGALEELDAALAAFLPSLTARQGVLVTADHGVIDIAFDAHVILDARLLDGVRHLAGEPRAPQLHLEDPASASEVADRLRGALKRTAWVATRAEAVEAGWFGEVDAEVLPRIGDVLIVARSRVAFYADENNPGRGMVGQHGALTPEETAIPLLRFGAYAR